MHRIFRPKVIPQETVARPRQRSFIGGAYRFTLPADNRARRLGDLVPGFYVGQYSLNVTIRNESSTNAVGVGPGGMSDAQLGSGAALTLWDTDPAEITFNALGNSITISVWLSGNPYYG